MFLAMKVVVAVVAVVVVVCLWTVGISLQVADRRLNDRS